MKTYSINELAQMTGLTTRTLRNYITMGLLEGDKPEGVWEFTIEEIEKFISNPNVKPAIDTKKKNIVFDFLADTEKENNEICSILDFKVTSEEGNEIMTFFCNETNSVSGGKIRMSCEKNGKNFRVILSGDEEIVSVILKKYYS